MLPSILLWPSIAAGAIVTAEYFMRSSTSYLWWFVPLGILINYAVFRSVHAGPTLMVSLALMAGLNLAGRAFISQFLLGEAVSRGNLVALAGLAFATAVGFLWR